MEDCVLKIRRVETNIVSMCAELNGSIFSPVLQDETLLLDRIEGSVLILVPVSAWGVS